MKFRSLAIGLTLLTAGSVIGVSAQQFASAEISSGDRPVLVPIEPCRLVDTRSGGNTVGPRSTPLGAADTLTVDAQEPETGCSGLIPADALSVSLNVTSVGATEQTFFTIWADGARPDASSLNPSPGAPPTPNAVTADLSVDQTFEIYNNLGSVDVIVDVNGYYENHDHDDRYYTEAEVDAAIAATDAALAAQKFINLQTVREYDGETTGTAGGPLDFHTSLVIPPDYTPGTDMRLELTYFNLDFTPAACSLTMTRNFNYGYRPAVGIELNDDGGGVSDGLSFPDGATIEFPGTERREFGSLTAIISRPGTIDYEPGDSLNFGFFASTDTCGATLRTHSAALYYE